MGELAIRLVAALWHVAGILLAVVLFAEYGLDWLRARSRQWRYGRTTRPPRSGHADAYEGAAWAVPYFDEFNRAVRLDYRPYVGWRLRPFRGEFVTIDERGLRVTPGEREAGPEALRILCFGGSTMMGMGARDDQTIAAHLARRLGELGHHAAVTNLGQLGYNSTQEAILLLQLLKDGVRPDLAVFFDGINDIVAAEQNGAADHVFHQAARHAEFNLLYPDRRPDLVTAALLAAFPRTTRRLRELTGLPLRGPLPAAPTDLAGIDLEALARQVVDNYAANLRHIRLVAAAYGIRPLFFWQPIIATKREKTEDERFYETQYTRDPVLRRRFYLAAVEQLRQHPELAAAGDAVDLSRLFDDHAGPVYIDLYHLSEAGNAAVAEAMLPALTAAVAAIRQPHSR